MNFLQHRFLASAAVVGLLVIGGLGLWQINQVSNLSEIGLSANITAPHVNGEVIVVIEDPLPFSPMSESGSIEPTSPEYETEKQQIQAAAETLLRNKLGQQNLQVESDVLFDRRIADYNEDRTFRMLSLEEENIYEPPRLVYAKATSSTSSAAQMITALENDPQILHIQANYVYQPPEDDESLVFVPQSFNAEDANSLWNIYNNSNNAGVRANLAWQQGYTGTDRVIAVIDTGVDTDHPDLAGNIWQNPGETDCNNNIDDDNNGYIDDCNGWDFGDNDNDPNGNNFHGTHTAGIIAAMQNETGVVGVAPNAKIMPLKIFPDSGYADTTVLLDAIEYAWRNNADIISTSLGRNDQCTSVEQQAIANAVNAGVFVVASSGNNDPANNFYVPFPNAPSICDNTISTGAVNRLGQLASYSNYFQTMVDMVAPGGESGDAIMSTTLNGGYSRSSGTSMAAPHVAGMAAILLEMNPSFTPSELQQFLCDGSMDLGPAGDDSFYGCGMIHAGNIVTQANASAPEISSGSWNPNPLTTPPLTSALTFSVCDTDDDLAGGEVRLFHSGSSSSFLGSHPLWSDNPPVPSASDCQNPVQHQIPIDFSAQPDGQYCVDVQVTDGDGNLSNRLNNVCLSQMAGGGSALSTNVSDVNITVGQTPTTITVTGGTNYAFTLLSNGTGITKLNCPDGAGGSCQLSPPVAEGAAVLMINSGAEATIVQITVSGQLGTQAQGDLTLLKTANRSTVVSGETIQYSLQYSNQGGDTFTDVSITDIFDSTRIQIDTFPSNCTVDSAQMTCDIGALNAGQAGTITYTATVQ